MPHVSVATDDLTMAAELAQLLQLWQLLQEITGQCTWNGGILPNLGSGIFTRPGYD